MYTRIETNYILAKADSDNILLYNNQFFEYAYLPPTIDTSEIIEMPKSGVPDLYTIEKPLSPRQIKVLQGSPGSELVGGNDGDIYILLDKNISIQYNLSHCVSECTSVAMPLGGMLITKIRPSTDYTLNTITVTMNDEDISSSVIVENRIIIPVVNGNIVITATATSNTVTDAVGSIDSSTNDITLNGTLSSGTYTLWYEDNNDTKLNGWAQIAEITK